MTSNQQRITLIGALIVLSLVILAPTFIKELPEWWPSRPIRLGLDLKGGSYLVLEVQSEEAVKTHLESVVTSLRTDMKKENAGLIRATTSGIDKIQLVLLGERGLERVEQFLSENYPQLARTKIEKTANRITLEYEISKKEATEIERNAVVQAVETIRNRVDQYGVAEPVIQRKGERRIVVQLPDITNLETVKKSIGSVAKLEFRLVAAPSAAQDETISVRNREGGRLQLEDQVLMSGNAIEKANVDINPQTNEVEVVLKLNSIGKKTFGDITSENVGQNLAIVLDGVVQSSPRINEAILGGTAQISGGFTRDEAHRLAVVLRSGALPAPLVFQEERVVGASLGADSIRKGLTSLAVGSLTVFIFTIAYYKRSGLLAVLGLLLNVLFLTSLLALVGATLTLPGIAGLVLTVGMAVDSNIIIFERIREELRAGSGVRVAIDAGFDKAHWTILDANISTLLSGVVLYVLGTGPIKGFAVTLCLGIVTTIFCALFVARTGFNTLNLRKGDGSLSI